MRQSLVISAIIDSLITGINACFQPNKKIKGWLKAKPCLVFLEDRSKAKRLSIAYP